MKYYDDYQKTVRWNWDYGCRHDLLEDDTEKLAELLVKLRSKEKKEKADLIKTGLRAAVVAIVFVVLISAYKLIFNQHDLAHDLTAAFSVYMKK